MFRYLSLFSFFLFAFFASVQAATISPTSFNSVEGSGLVVDLSSSTVSGSLISGDVTFSVDLDNDGIFDDGSHTGGVFSFDWSTLVANAINNNGTFIGQVSIADLDGTSTGNVNFVVANVAPTVVITAPIGGEEFSGSVTIERTSTDPVDSLDYTIQYSTGGIFSLLTTGATSSGTDSYVWDTSAITSSTVGITMTVNDGDITHGPLSTISFVVDNTGPVVVASAVGINEGEDASIDLSGSSDAGVGLASGSYSVELNGTIFNSHTAGVFSLTRADLNMAGITNDGTYNFTGTVTDDLGNVGVGTGSLVVSNIAPTVSITAPTVGQEFTGSVNVGWTSTEAFDSSLDYTLSYSTDGTTYNQITTGTTASGADSYAWDSSAVDSTNVTLQLVVNDGTDTGTGTSAVFTVDNTGPVVDLSIPTINEGRGVTIVMTGTSDATVGMTGAMFSLLVSGALHTSTSGVFDLSRSDLNAASIDNDGVFAVTGSVSDRLGNTSVLGGNLTVLNVAPTISFSGPNAGEQFSGVTNVSWITTEPVDNPLAYELSYSLDGSTYVFVATGNTSAGSDSYTWNSSALNSDNVTLQMVVTDDDVSLTGTSAVFTVDNTGPVVSFDNNNGIGAGISAYDDRGKNQPMSFAGSTDNIVGIASYHIDINNDGTYDFNGSSTDYSMVRDTALALGISNAGSYSVTVRVVDILGNETIQTENILYFIIKHGGSTPGLRGGNGGGSSNVRVLRPTDLSPIKSSSSDAMTNYIENRRIALKDDKVMTVLDSTTERKYGKMIRSAMAAISLMPSTDRYTKVETIVERIQKMNLDALPVRIKTFVQYLEDQLIMTLNA